MKKASIFLFVFFPSFLSAQIVQVSAGEPVPPFATPADHQLIGYFNFSADQTVRIEDCKIEFQEGFNSIDHLYLSIEETPYISWGEEFLVNPLTHSVDFLLNFEGEENASFQYFADVLSVGGSTDIAYTLTCLVSDYHDPSNLVWTEVLSLETSVYTSIRNAGKPSGVIVKGKILIVPPNKKIEIYSMTGQEVFSIKGKLAKEQYSLNLPKGIYLLVVDDIFSGRFNFD